MLRCLDFSTDAIERTFPNSGHNDFFFFLKAMDNFSSEVESDRYIIESVGKFFCCKNTLKISQASLSSRAWHCA